MKAVVITEFGGPEVLRVQTVERPRPGSKEILVRVSSSGLNRADLIQRMGNYPAPPESPQDIPGLEYSGVVEEVGPNVTLWKVGDRVMGILGGGGYAEFVVVHERTAVKIPAGVETVEAGAIPEVFMTAFDALFRQMNLSEGESVLIHAVGSGVGTAAVQLTQSAGVRAIGTSRTPQKVDRALELGLDVGILGDDNWPERVLEASGGEGVDVILDLVGGAYLEGNLKVMASEGRHVVVGVPSGARGQIDLRLLMKKRALIKGTVLRARPLEEKISLAREFEHRVCPLFAARKVRPVVDSTYRPEAVSEAHTAMAENRNFGKLLLTWE
ncbi:MAG: NAD(P)H-quinone oxidoreductase [Gemmatimonadetes bacterium]|nr:NAD(P)H-quinone oxidoreductase [Gemmatimonadota bacterium]NNM05092.1 NAD(P)H-quinone oxidoreductase [Gemmatimonadota bacterium]